MKSAYLSYIFALLLFGTNGIVASHIDLSSTEIVLYRTFIGSLLLISIFVLSRRKWTFYKHRKDFIFLALSGISMGASWMFLYEAYKQIGVSISSLLYYCGPIVVMMLAPVVFKEKLTANKVLGFIIVFLGIILVNGNLVADGSFRFGIFCGAMSALTYSCMVIFNKKAKSISGLENSTLQLTISFITVAIITVIKGGFVINVPQGSIFPLIFLGLINTGLGCYLYFSRLDELPVQSVSILGYLEPLSAVIMSVIFLNEAMDVAQIVGAVCVLGGAMYAELAGNKKK